MFEGWMFLLTENWVLLLLAGLLGLFWRSFGQNPAVFGARSDAGRADLADWLQLR